MFRIDGVLIRSRTMDSNVKNIWKDLLPDGLCRRRDLRTQPCNPGLKLNINFYDGLVQYLIFTDEIGSVATILRSQPIFRPIQLTSG